jgi:alanine racemase
MKGNVIVGQSGGPTAVINSSLAGVYKTAMERGFTKVYGMRNGIQGFLDEQYIDMSQYIRNELDLELLKRTPSAFLGTCRRQKRNSGLRPVCHGEATLDNVRWLPKGHTVGNETLITLRRPTRVGILPVGYQHGLGIRRTRKRGFFAFLTAWRSRRRRFVTVDGQKARVLGPIGALETAVDITDLKCAEGDVAEFPIDSLFARGLPRTYQ